jgi:hypothetical protein
MVGMMSWHSRQDLSVIPAAESNATPQADSNEVNQTWPPTNLWYPVAALFIATGSRGGFGGPGPQQ